MLRGVQTWTGPGPAGFAALSLEDRVWTPLVKASLAVYATDTHQKVKKWVESGGKNLLYGKKKIESKATRQRKVGLE